MKTYRRHNCTRNHRTYRTAMKCMIPRAAWITGEGEYALIAWCRVPTISLWKSIEDAESSKEFIDGYACGGRCSRRHEIVHIVRDSDK